LLDFLIQKNFISNIALLSTIFIFYLQNVVSRKIILIQNAEPDEHDNSILSIVGESRSICLKELLENEENMIPQIIYAQNPNGDIYTPLPLQTVDYLAKKLNIKVNDTFKERQQAKLASTIENLPDEIETVLLCWNRYQIELLVRTLGIDDPPKWNDGFDNLWIVEDDHLNDTTQNISSCIKRVKAELVSDDASSMYKKYSFPFILFLSFLLLLLLK